MPSTWRDWTHDLEAWALCHKRYNFSKNPMPVFSAIVLVIADSCRLFPRRPSATVFMGLRLDENKPLDWIFFLPILIWKVSRSQIGWTGRECRGILANDETNTWLVLGKNWLRLLSSRVSCLGHLGYSASLTALTIILQKEVENFFVVLASHTSQY